MRILEKGSIKDVLDRLTESGFDPSTIDALVLSHQHFDHIGDISKVTPGQQGIREISFRGYQDRK
jgi:metal-dependent hydrolase (beta-lactamase superfamily II)